MQILYKEDISDMMFYNLRQESKRLITHIRNKMFHSIARFIIDKLEKCGIDGTIQEYPAGQTVVRIMSVLYVLRQREVDKINRHFDEAMKESPNMYIVNLKKLVNEVLYNNFEQKVNDDNVNYDDLSREAYLEENKQRLLDK